MSPAAIAWSHCNPAVRDGSPAGKLSTPYPRRYLGRLRWIRRVFTESESAAHKCQPERPKPLYILGAQRVCRIYHIPTKKSRRPAAMVGSRVTNVARVMILICLYESSPAELRANTDAIYAGAHSAMAPRPTFDIERAGFAYGTIRIKRIAIGLLIVPVARESSSCTHTKNLTGRPGTVTARRTIGIKEACSRLCIRQDQHKCSRHEYHAVFLQDVAPHKVSRIITPSPSSKLGSVLCARAS